MLIANLFYLYSCHQDFMASPSKMERLKARYGHYRCGRIFSTHIKGIPHAFLEEHKSKKIISLNKNPFPNQNLIAPPIKEGCVFTNTQDRGLASSKYRNLETHFISTSLNQSHPSYNHYFCGNFQTKKDFSGILGKLKMAPDKRILVRTKSRELGEELAEINQDTLCVYSNSASFQAMSGEVVVAEHIAQK